MTTATGHQHSHAPSRRLLSAAIVTVFLLVALAGAALPARASVAIADAKARAQSWVDAQVGYSQTETFTNQYGTYRTDCSGYVSMIWALPSSLTTRTLPAVAHQISKNELASGDILLFRGGGGLEGHVVMFDKWANEARTRYWAYEELGGGPGPYGALYHEIEYPYWGGTTYGTYLPYRKNGAVVQSPAPLSMSLIVDSSGSMTSSDPGNRRVDAANAYVAASLPTDEVAVVDFDGSSRVAIPAVPVGTNRQALSDAIRTIDSSGGTDLGAGLSAGHSVLDAASGVARAAIFLTDGQGSYSGQATLFRDKGWKIYTIGLGGGVDSTILRQIANETGGRYIELSSSTNLVCEFQQIRKEVVGLPTDSCEPSGIILQGATNTLQVTVPGPSLQGGTVPIQGTGAIGQATITVVWGGSDIAMTLTSPSGRTIDRLTSDPDVVVYSGPTYETFTITDPEPGEWTVDLYGADIPVGGEEYFFSTVMIPKPDRDGPVITWIDPMADGSSYPFGSVPSVPTCLAEDEGSGVDADGCVVSGYTTAPGMHLLLATATDNAGNTTTEHRSYIVRFRDVPASAKFSNEITWLATQGISTGWPDGTFRPIQPVNRDAMAAFLYRLAGSPPYTPPAASPFKDVRPATQFYKEICWLASTGISTGWSDGTFRPLNTIDRDAMAAFLFRFATREDAASTAGFIAPNVSPFVDVAPSDQFFKEMAWLASTGISTGWPTREGAEYRPWSSVNRDAMAAFMFRYDAANAP